MKNKLIRSMTTASIGVVTLGLLGVGIFLHRPVNGQDTRGFIAAAGEQKNGDITTGLVSHWPMDEGTGKVAKDVGGGNHGVFERGEPEWVKGRIGKGALSFSESCYLNCGKGESLNMTKAMTFAAWIKKPQDGRKSRIASKHGFMNETNAGWLILCGGVKKDNIEWRISVTGSDWHGGFTTPKSFPYDAWNHLAVTYDGAVMRAYINGVEDTGGDFPCKVSGAIHISSAETLLGQDRAHGQVFGGPKTWSFTGSMDDARLYNRSLSAEDVKALFTHRGEPLAAPAIAADHPDRIQPWPKNPRYWQYKGQPVMLLGGSKTDHLFLLDDLKSHLDEIHAVGANYVRNTMSQREGKELKPHKLLPDGRFDLDQWNEEYWQRFQNMLKWTAERDIFVQIEVWDRFDYAERNWETSPWNPKNNINYDYVQTGFAKEYTANQLYKDAHPFFHTIEGTSHYVSRYDLIRKYQEAFVAKMLSYSLPYGHVLYCMNNETSSEAGWGQYWMTFIRNRAAQQGVTVFCTDMFDDVWAAKKSVKLRQAFDDPQMYPFLDVSQVNSRTYDEGHWDNLLWIAQQREAHPRPLNHTKIYGSGYKTFGTGGPEDGIERFWRNILGGSASVRFHRPDSGNGLNDLAKSTIKAARILESQFKFWEITPHMELLSDRASNEAYLAATPGERYALYFTNGGSVGLDLTRAPGTFNITWISVSMGITVQTSAKGGYRLMDTTIEGGRVVTLPAPYTGGWVAAIMKK